MEERDKSPFRVVIAAGDDKNASDIAAELEAQGAEQIDVQHDGAGFFTLPVIGAFVVGYMSVTGFTAWVVNWWRTRGKDGVLLQVTPAGEVKTQSLPIPYGQVILVTKDGQWLRYEDTDKEKLGELITKLLSGLVPAGGKPTSAREVRAASDSSAEKGGEAATGS